MNPVLTIAKRAALSAGRILLRHFDHLERLTVTAKQRSDFVSEADIQAEREIIQILRRTYPSHGILAEESGAQAGQDDYQWIIDHWMAPPTSCTAFRISLFPSPFAIANAWKRRWSTIRSARRCLSPHGVKARSSTTAESGSAR